MSSISINLLFSKAWNLRPLSHSKQQILISQLSTHLNCLELEIGQILQVQAILPLHMQYLSWASTLLFPRKSFEIQEDAINFVDAPTGKSSVSNIMPRTIVNDPNVNVLGKKNNICIESCKRLSSQFTCKVPQWHGLHDSALKLVHPSKSTFGLGNCGVDKVSDFYLYTYMLHNI
jgi:hypothetical protein